jgi:hypothetical protein
MLDVHPPHHAATTWRDFLIHIATIVIGLLIALGLEQTVEWVHHRNELREAREALDKEHEENTRQFAINTDYLAENINAYQNNLIVLVYLRDHPKTPRSKLPGVLVWPNLYGTVSDIAWRSVQSANITQLMPRDEVSDYANAYEALHLMELAAEDSWQATSLAMAYTFSDPDPTHMSPTQLEHEIELTQGALLGKFRLGIFMANIGKTYPGFSHAPSMEDLQHLSIAAPLTPQQRAELAEATKITTDRLDKTPIPH